MPRFEATVTAAQLARLSGAKLVMGSATPGLREAYLAQHGVINKITLGVQFNKLKPEPPLIVDLKDAREFTDQQIFSRTLTRCLSQTFEHGRQSLLFLNRRGSAASQLCTNCAFVSLCPRCRLPLTFHADKAKLICHSCNFSQPPPAICPSCGQAALRFLGIGTKRVETELAQLLPQARIARLDRDSLAGGIEQLYAELRDHKIDVLIGTQMVAKGLDLPAMETIGVVLADSSLYLPDYTATERTYSLLTQVSGRAGRGQHPGRTIIQTYSAQHPAIQALAHQDYWQFAAAELSERRSLGYPPFNFLLKLTYADRSDEAAAGAAGKLASEIKSITAVTVLGPAPAWRQFAGGSSHWQLIIKSPRRQTLQQIAANLPKGWSSDLDPVNLL
jgi:primosomal protein N' (replication factor Y)